MIAESRIFCNKNQLILRRENRAVLFYLFFKVLEPTPPIPNPSLREGRKFERLKQIVTRKNFGTLVKSRFYTIILKNGITDVSKQRFAIFFPSISFGLR